MSEQAQAYVTRQAVRTATAAAVDPSMADGNFSEGEYAARSSVEVGQDAKGTAYCKSAKAYHNNPDEAARLAVAAFKLAQMLLSQKGEQP